MHSSRKRRRLAEPDVPLSAPSPAIEAGVLEFDKKIGTNAGDAAAAAAAATATTADVT